MILIEMARTALLPLLPHLPPITSLLLGEEARENDREGETEATGDRQASAEG